MKKQTRTSVVSQANSSQLSRGNKFSQKAIATGGSVEFSRIHTRSSGRNLLSTHKGNFGTNKDIELSMH